MKKLFALFATVALGLLAVSSCIEDEYDLEKDIDSTVELKKVTIKINRTFVFSILDILPSQYSSAQGDFVANLPGGVLGTFKIDKLAQDIDDDYEFKKANVNATVINELPKPFKATAVAIDKNGNVLSSITATLLQPSVPTGESKITVQVVSSSKIDLDGVKLELKMDETQVTFNSNQKITVKNIVIEFPDGVTVKD